MGRVGVSQAARLADVSETTIRSWERRGWLKAERLAPWGYASFAVEDVATVAAWLRQRQEETARLAVPPHVRRQEREEATRAYMDVRS